MGRYDLMLDFKTYAEQEKRIEEGIEKDLHRHPPTKKDCSREACFYYIDHHHNHCDKAQ